MEKEVVQLPPKRYVPKFYKWCTIAHVGDLAIGDGLLAIEVVAEV